MSYASIDTLQSMLKDSVFYHTQDAKKAAGRALGTLVEIITYYLLRTWGHTDRISIERGLPEYGNTGITHNVEFLLHPIIDRQCIRYDLTKLPVSYSKIKNLLHEDYFEGHEIKKGNVFLNGHNVLRNSCLLAESKDRMILSNANDGMAGKNNMTVSCLYKSPFAMIECKRVGVEEGCKKGPQTIEKAKQGAYVALNTSALQKVWNEKGEINGLLYKDGNPVIKPYDELLSEIIHGTDMLKNFIMSIGVVSNHGNWFTANNKNKELEVLSQAYDWLIFLTDEGLSQFVTDLLLTPQPCYIPIKKAFSESYRQGKKMNVFTKTKIDLDAHKALCLYFSRNIKTIENTWFNIITPKNKSLGQLAETLTLLGNKDWRAFL